MPMTQMAHTHTPVRSTSNRLLAGELFELSEASSERRSPRRRAKSRAPKKPLFNISGAKLFCLGPPSAALRDGLHRTVGRSFLALLVRWGGGFGGSPVHAHVWVGR